MAHVQSDVSYVLVFPAFTSYILYIPRFSELESYAVVDKQSVISASLVSYAVTNIEE
jgi:hypothetical protein